MPDYMAVLIKDTTRICTGMRIIGNRIDQATVIFGLRANGDIIEGLEGTFGMMVIGLLKRETINGCKDITEALMVPELG